MRALLVLALLLLSGLRQPALAAAPTLDELRKQADLELEMELAAIAPDALPLLREANRARAQEEPQALVAYAELHRRFPTFSGATRRLCTLEHARGKRAEALALCREAAYQGSASNLLALASVLSDSPGSLDEIREAQGLAARAHALEPDDPWVHWVTCQLAIRTRELTGARRCTLQARSRLPPELSGSLAAALGHALLEENLPEAKELATDALNLAPDEAQPILLGCEVALRSSDFRALNGCVSTLRAKMPAAPGTHFYAAILAANQGSWSEAYAELDRAESLGGNPESVRALREQLLRSEPAWRRYWKPLAITLAVWLGGLSLLFAAGVTLGRMAARAAREPVGQNAGRATGMSAALRTTYAVVIALCGVYYYVSIPLVLLLVVGIGGGIVVAVLATGFVAPKLFLVIGFVVVVTVFAMLRSVFVRAPRLDPGLSLERSAHPRFERLLREVSIKIGARNVDRVFLAPDASIAVFERGSTLRQLGGAGERCLLLGVAALNGMRLGELRAILAHEFGHFSNRDTAGGHFALGVRNSLQTTLLRLAHGGAATAANPAWLFVTQYFGIFLRISQGASRLQEVLADRWAAHAYGSENFVRGLRHVIRANVAFSRHVDGKVAELVRSNQPVVNLYEAIDTEAAPGTLDELVEQEINRPPSAFDSHPSPQERIALVRALPAEPTARDDDDDDAWALFENRTKLEETLTRIFCKDVYGSP